MAKSSVRRFRSLVTATLREPGPEEKIGTSDPASSTLESAAESTGGGSIGEDVVKESVEALEDRLAKVAGSHAAMTDEDRKIIADGREAGKKIVSEGAGAILSQDERFALEAIAIGDGSRPALFISGDTIVKDDERAKEWADELEKFGNAIKKISPSVGRIDTGGKQVGTGWMIRPGYIVTNRHVAQELSKDPTAKNLQLNPLREQTICFGCEMGESGPRPRHVIKEIIVCGPDYIDPSETNLAHLDLAVLKTDVATQAKLPPSLPTAFVPQNEIKRGMDLYALGYPGTTARSSLPQKTLLRLLGEPLGVKRLSPGEIDLELGKVPNDTPKRSIAHDATSLPGSSGSVIFCFDEFGEARLVGLHFGGYEVKYGPGGDVEYRGRNYAHAIAGMPDVIKLIDAAIAADRPK